MKCCQSLLTRRCLPSPCACLQNSTPLPFIHYALANRRPFLLRRIPVHLGIHLTLNMECAIGLINCSRCTAYAAVTVIVAKQCPPSLSVFSRSGDRCNRSLYAWPKAEKAPAGNSFYALKTPINQWA